jgi:hypothetical protein
MRQRNTNIPNKYFDKTQFEKYLFENIDKVTRELKFHFFVSDEFYNQARNTRKILLEEFVGRIMEFIGTDETEGTVFLYVYDSGDSQINSVASEQGESVDPKDFLSTAKLKYQVYKF